MAYTRVTRIIAAVVSVIALSQPAAAQQSSGIAGVVRDTSGGVLPGVSVEAASPALIEKVRTVVTDDQGRYNIVDLRPGTYVVTFALTGFRSVRREEIELTGGFTAAINADLEVGAVEETVTVSGASPLVDVQNTRNQTRVSDEVLSALPTSTKGVINLLVLTPGVSGAADVGGTLGLYRSMGAPQLTTFRGRTGMKVSYDGMDVLNTAGEGNASYIVNQLNVQEMALESGGISAESASSGFASNAIPREGGNRFASSISGLFSNKSLNSDNLSDELRERGVASAERIRYVYDIGLVVSGPVRQDRLWFLASVRAEESRNEKGNIFYNATHGTPLYTPDFARAGDRHERAKFASGRLTWQASPRNKVGAFFELQALCGCPREGTVAPEAANGLDFFPQGLAQVTWNSPRTSRFLLEAGASVMFSDWPTWVPPEASAHDISILETSTNFAYNAPSGINSARPDQRWVQRFSGSYVTGTHAFKAGIYTEYLVSGTTSDPLQDRKIGFLGEEYGNISYRFLGGVPNGITQNATPRTIKDRATGVGLFVQDQWVVRRVTINYGVRYDYFYGYVPEQSAPAGVYVPARSFEAVKGVPDWSDISPRLGASFDLFGNGRTALKGYVGRYVNKEATTLTSQNNPFTTSVASTQRTWNDRLYPVGDPRRGNFAPDCDLTNPLTNGECGALANQNFGRTNPNATRYADDVLRGFGNRPASWDITTELQQQLGSGISVTGGYYRSWHKNFRITDNVEVTPDDYSSFCITAPSDPRLPGGGGYPVCGLYDVAPAKFGRVSSLVRPAADFGSRTRTSDFIGLNFMARLPGGNQFGGGLDTGRTVDDACFVVDSRQELLNCRVVQGFKSQTQIKLHGSYGLPAAFFVAGVLQNVPGSPYLADYLVPNAEIAPSLGRNLAACGAQAVCNATARVPLIAPNTFFEKRRVQLDLRVSREFRIRSGGRLQANVDFYNVLNDGSVLSSNALYGDRWRLPESGATTVSGSGLLVGRLVQFSGQLRF